MPLKVVPQRIFFFAIALIVGGAALSGFTMYKLFTSERWVRHTYLVRLEMSQIEAYLSRAGRIRLSYLNTADRRYQKDFEDTRKLLEEKLVAIHTLTNDNPEQLANCEQLDKAVNSRLDILQLSIQQGGAMVSNEQLALTEALMNSAYNTSAVIERMDQIEEDLLQRRRAITSSIFVIILVILVAILIASIFLFRMYYRLLAAQLRERQLAETNARALSTELMHVQDEERRKLSVELHDGIGQIITGAKMMAGRMGASSPADPRFPELEAMLEDGLQQTRTLSHLLHPPMLDQIGLMSAARWFVESYRQRTGVNASFEGPEDIPHLPTGLELALFRVMQEALTNVHKHSRATNATVQFVLTDDTISLRVHDNGIGIPTQKMERFRADGTGMGIGIIGMKQRVREQGGSFSVTSDSASGTIISALFLLNGVADRGSFKATRTDSVPRFRN
jgi:signal transduction histidine kinase